MSAADTGCHDERRRQLIRDRKLNGIDSVDVTGTHLCVHFLTGIPGAFLPRKGAAGARDWKAAAMAHIVIAGGRRITGIRVLDLDPDQAPSKFDESCLGIELDKEGDWSTYTIRFVETAHGRPTDVPLKSLDPRYAHATFTFKSECPAEIDCQPVDTCAVPPAAAPPGMSYLAKDYATFRQLILDRLALTMPDWRERHVPDLGLTLVELLAYVADHLSYFQDAVGTEQYLDTARQRISVRRHARLVDYTMHEGCNARVFVQLQAGSDDDTIRPRDVYFITRADAAPILRQADVERLAPGWLAFEPLTDRPALKLRVAHNAITIYTWGDERCCLSKGAMQATLLDESTEHDRADPHLCDERPWPPVDHYHDEKCGCGQTPPPKPPAPRVLDLAVGDFLLFEELACAGTAFNSTSPDDGGFDGKTPLPDVDRTHRHVVRLTRITKGCDALRGNRLLEVEWAREDALPFSLCISAIGTAPQCDLVRNMAVARGNVVLVDHGATIADEPLPPVDPRTVEETCQGEDALVDVARVAARYRPRLQHAPLTFAEPLQAGASAWRSVRQDPRAALPAIALAGIPASPDGLQPLFTGGDVANLERLAERLFSPEAPPLVALRRRLKADVKRLLDGRKVTKALLDGLDANLRALTETWTPRADLLDSGPDDPALVAEINDAGFAELRFGDGECGRAPDVGMAFMTTYRAGNGRAGLIGPESIGHVVFRRGISEVVTGIRNPLPAAGAVDSEPIADVKMYAPGAFRTRLDRAVTAADYAALARTLPYPDPNPRVQSAAAALRWTGSWYEADVAIDQSGSSTLDPSLRSSIAGMLQRYRRMGHDLRVDAAASVPIRLELDLCIHPDYLRAHILAAVRDVLSSRMRSGGVRGFFHPDNLTFGEAIHASRIVAAVMAVAGVAETRVVRLERLEHLPHRNPDLVRGVLKLRPNEIARLDNDPSRPEDGLLTFRRVRGGR